MTEKQFEALHRKQVYIPDHPYCTKSGQVREYRLEVEKAIGRYLKPEEQVHHHYNADGSVTLVLCPDQAYHRLLHRREEALRYCGHADWRKCVLCKQYDDPKNMCINQNKYHKQCNTAYHRKWRCKINEWNY